MLNRVKIQGFRSLVSLDVPVHPLTVLIGDNDSGKSTFLKAVELIANQELQFGPTDRYRHDQEHPISIEGYVQNGGIVRNDTNRGRIGHPSITPAQFYQLPVAGVDMTSDGYDDQGGAEPLRRHGQGLPGLLDYLFRR